VSSLHNAPFKVVCPELKAARINARFVSLLDPGIEMRALGGVARGWMAMRSGRAIIILERYQIPLTRKASLSLESVCLI
jgi:hypothetical protein